MPYLALGVLKVDKNGFGADPGNRAAEFDMTVQQANALLKVKQGGRAGVRMLVAPEYFWSGYGPIGKVYRRPGPLVMDRDDKHALYSALKTTSKKAGSLVLVAGSIFYHKPRGTTDAAYNVCPVLRNGSFLLKAYKEFDDGAADMNPGTLTYSVKESRPYFKVEGIGFGLEVCGEHGRVARWNATAGKTIRVQILVSDGMLVHPPYVVATSHVVHCDIGGSALAVAVYPAGAPYDRSTAISAEGISAAQVNGGTVHYWGLHV